MAALFWYLWKSNLYSVHVYSSVHWTIHFLQGTSKTWPCLTGYPVIVCGGHGHRRTKSNANKHCTGCTQLNMAVFFWYLVKSFNVNCELPIKWDYIYLWYKKFCNPFLDSHLYRIRLQKQRGGQMYDLSTSHFKQGTKKTRTCLTGHPVCNESSW